jgi:hypothetical protein
VALILSVNPGGRHNAALSRLARALLGHELNGADSCAVAIAAINRRAPDLVLLPPLPDSEEANLLSRLRAVPGGVRMLRLPFLALDNPRLLAEFADQVRESLEAPPGASLVEKEKDERRLHLVAAAAALASWVRARRATWTDAVTADPVRHAAVKTASARKDIAKPLEEATDAAGPPESFSESGVKVAAHLWRDWRDSILRWLPRVAVLVTLIALADVALTYVTDLRTRLNSGVLMLESGPAGSQVFIDGRLAGTTPISVDLPAGRYSVEFRSGDMSRTTEVAVVARSRAVERVDWMLTPTGTLQVRSDPPGARVLVDGAPLGMTPLTLGTIAVGAHVVTLESEAGAVSRTVTIVAGRTVQLSESIFPGWLAVVAPFEIEISEGSGLIQPDGRGRAMLPAGSHKLRFRNRNLGYDAVRTVEINSGTTTTLNLAPQTTISITATEPSEVSIDGTPVGQTPIANLRINLGSRVVLVRSVTGVERTFTVTATAKRVEIEVDFSEPPG